MNYVTNQANCKSGKCEHRTVKLLWASSFLYTEIQLRNIKRKAKRLFTFRNEPLQQFYLKHSVNLTSNQTLYLTQALSHLNQ